jgi:hypothetical protein
MSWMVWINCIPIQSLLMFFIALDRWAKSVQSLSRKPPILQSSPFNISSSLALISSPVSTISFHKLAIERDSVGPTVLQASHADTVYSVARIAERRQKASDWSMASTFISHDLRVQKRSTRKSTSSFLSYPFQEPHTRSPSQSMHYHLNSTHHNQPIYMYTEINPNNYEAPHLSRKGS